MILNTHPHIETIADAAAIVVLLFTVWRTLRLRACQECRRWWREAIRQDVGTPTSPDWRVVCTYCRDKIKHQRLVAGIQLQNLPMRGPKE